VVALPITVADKINRQQQQLRNSNAPDVTASAGSRLRGFGFGLLCRVTTGWRWILATIKSGASAGGLRPSADASCQFSLVRWEKSTTRRRAICKNPHMLDVYFPANADEVRTGYVRQHCGRKS
jgi:hypothetical protein